MTDITIYIDWIRHGFSCANVLKEIGEAGVKNVFKNISKGVLGESRAVYAKDSKLSNFGIEQVEEVNKNYENRINQYDMVLCSELTRAVETAMIMCKKSNIKIIYMVPYISEERSSLALELDKDNQARNPEIIKKELEEKYKTTDGYPEINIYYVTKFRGTFSEKIATKPDINLFINKILFDIVHKISIIKTSAKIGIVSHHHFIKNIFTKNYPGVLVKPIQNTQIISEKIVFNKGKIKSRESLLDCNCIENSKPLSLSECSKKEKCQIPLSLQQKGIFSKSNFKINDVDNCFDNTDTRLKRLIESKINTPIRINKGGYYDKYVKYKSKYLSLKNQLTLKL